MAKSEGWRREAMSQCAHKAAFLPTGPGGAQKAGVGFSSFAESAFWHNIPGTAWNSSVSIHLVGLLPLAIHLKVLPLRFWIAAAIVSVAAVPTSIALRLKPGAPLPPRVVSVAFSPNSERLAAGLYNGTVQVWQTTSWQPLRRLQAEDGGLNTLEFSPDSKLVAIAGRSLSLWTTSNARQWKRLGVSGAVYGTARFDKPGSHIASVNSAEQIELWNIQTGGKVRTLCCMALYGDVAFSPDNRLLAAAGHWPRLWDISTGREVYRLVQTRNPTFASIQFRSDRKLLATGSQDGIAKVWRVSTGTQLFASPVRQGYIETIAFQPGGDSIAYGVRDGPIWLWNLKTQLEQSVTADSSSNVASIPRGHWLAFGTPGLVHVWDIDHVRELVRLRFPVGQ